MIAYVAFKKRSFLLARKLHLDLKFPSHLPRENISESGNMKKPWNYLPTNAVNTRIMNHFFVGNPVKKNVFLRGRPGPKKKSQEIGNHQATKRFSNCSGQPKHRQDIHGDGFETNRSLMPTKNLESENIPSHPGPHPFSRKNNDDIRIHVTPSYDLLQFL